MTDLSPRQWGKGDPEPADRPKVRDRHGDVWTAHPTGVWETPETMPCTWEYIARKFHPLTEVPERTDEEIEDAVARAFNERWAEAKRYDVALTPAKSSQDAPTDPDVPCSCNADPASYPLCHAAEHDEVGGQGSGETPATDELRGFDWERAQLAAVIFETWKMLGPNATPQNASPTIAADVIRAGWRAPSTQDETDWEYGYQIGDNEPFGPMSHRASELSLLGIDGVIKKRRPAGPWVSVSSVEGDNG